MSVIKQIVRANIISILFFSTGELYATEAPISNIPIPPYSVEEIRKWHTTLSPWPWLGKKEEWLTLRKDDKELLLAIAGYSRGATYVLFTKNGRGWMQISDAIENAHHPIRVLEIEKNGWRDFETFLPLWGSGGNDVAIFRYSWNGEKYINTATQRGKWCDYEPFKSDKSLCSL